MLLKEADEIVNGKVRIFGELVSLDFTFQEPLRHWTEYETQKTLIPHSSLLVTHNDIKFLWEPARFAGHLLSDAPITSRRMINTPKPSGNILKPSHKIIPRTSVRIG